MNNSLEYEYEIIGKYISGEISAEERQELDQWLNESNENVHLFESIKKYDELSCIYKELKKIDVLKAKELTWHKINKINRIKERIEIETNETVQKIVLKRVLWVAASLLLVLGIGSWLYFGLHKTIVSRTITQITAPIGSRTNLKLADGSTIWLNAGSTLTYDNSFNKNDRVVYLDGEAFFEVSKNPQKPFYVKTSDISMKVLGTSFNVKSYSDEGTIQTTLVTGSVVIQRNNALNGNDKVVLKPNQKAIFIKKQNQMVVDNIVNQHKAAATTRKGIPANDLVASIPVSKKEQIVIADQVNIEQDISWKDGYMLIKQESLEDLAVKLARHYDVVFTFQSEDIKKYRYTGKLYDLTLDQVLNAIKFSSPIDYKIVKKNVIISKKM